MQPVPSRFLVRLARKCLNHPNVPLAKGDALLDLSSEFSIASLCVLDGQEEFAELRICWNAQGLGFQATITGKKQPPEGDNTRPRSSDGITIWIDTRDSRSSHRATRYCHQFHFLASGAGPDREDPCFVQSKIHRALQDAPFCNPSEIMFRCTNEPSGYFMEAFLQGMTQKNAQDWGYVFKYMTGNWATRYTTAPWIFLFQKIQVYGAN